MTKRPPASLLPIALAAIALVVATASLARCERVDATPTSKRSSPAAAADAVAEAMPERIDFNRHIRPIFNENCIACHGGVKAAGGLSFLFREEALVRGESGQWAIKAGSPDESQLLDLIVNEDAPMPPEDHGPMLSEHQVALLRQWIEEGAKWAEHWAYIPPQKTEVPDLGDDWSKNPIDRFVLSRLRGEGLEPNPAAEPGPLLRRMSLDLIGLPPSLADYRRFETAWTEDPDAAVAAEADRLLASPHFGERWAALWMDLSRYADTKGYEKDQHRNAWPYRDYLIRSFDEDKPYDRFLIEQIAGDLLPDGGAEGLVATLFSRNTQTNEEGGTDDEEFRVAAVIDRVNTTWSAVMGTSFGCVQCHSHPYDPIRHDEYFKFYSFFNNTADTDDLDAPTMSIPAEPAAADESVALQQEAVELRLRRDAPVIELANQADWQFPEILRTEVSGDGILEPTELDGLPLLDQSGTVPSGSEYRIDLGVPVEAPLAALRIEVPVPSGTEGQATTGFVITHLALGIVAADGSVSNVPLQLVASDYNRGDRDLAGILHTDAGHGWWIYPQQFRSHQLVVVPAEPAGIPEGGHLRLVLHHDYNNERSDTHTKRLRLSVSDEPRFASIHQDSRRVESSSRLEEIVRRIDQLGGTQVPVLVNRPEVARRNTYTFVAGNWMTLGEEQQPGVPEIMQPLEVREEGERADRLDLARWIASRENPLTARVMVNRLWAELFGRGIVSNLGDFGSQADQPTHPELLDWLAVTFMDEHGWRVKPLLREIVTSATYRQSSVADAEAHQADPHNELLARGPLTRLNAEMVRDQALAVAGLLSARKFGPSVMPPQPEGVWQTVNNSASWITSEGEDRYRRALYTYWRRTSPYPSMITFDAPSREVCVTERVSTNTPLHALTTLNDPVYFEAAQEIGRQILKQSPDPDQIGPGLADAYLHATGRQIGAATREELSSLYRDLRAAYTERPEESTLVADTPELAAMTVVANVLLNLDEIITR